MKCVHNGVMNFSVLDGWWIEGYMEGQTGWAIGPETTDTIDAAGYNEAEDATDLYNKLEKKYTADVLQQPAGMDKNDEICNFQ